MSLDLRNITVSFGDTVAVSNVDLSIRTGERFAVMGPSGSGKSTLLRVIAGLTATDTGTISIDNEDMTKTAAHVRPVGLMFQDYALFPHMTVLENVAYGLRMAGVESRQRSARAGELLDLVGLSGFGGRAPETLSGGEQQRVALARTLAPSPSLVLLDEPLGSLDVSLRENLLKETRSILDAFDTTSIYVTHDRGEAFAFADRMAILDGGNVVRIGTPDDIWHAPGSEFVARAIGQSNLIPRHFVGRSGQGLCFVPSGSASISPSGALEGRIVHDLFQDGMHTLTVAMDGTEVTLDISSVAPAAVDSLVRFDIDPDAAIDVSVDEI
ncbi:MAG: ABC transporter ATP-binding protein [Actinomycetota bacterium]